MMKQSLVVNPYPRWGCFLCSLVHGVEEASGHNFSMGAMWEIYALCLADGYIDWECTIKNPDGVLQIISNVGDVDLKITQFSVYDATVASAYRSQWPYRRFTVIQGTTLARNDHYVYGGRDGATVVWDPYVPPREFVGLDYVWVYKVEVPT